MAKGTAKKPEAGILGDLEKYISKGNGVSLDDLHERTDLFGKTHTRIDQRDKLGVFEEFVEPGSPFRLLAKEQQALLLIEQGKLELAIKALSEISVDSETTASLKRRVTQLRISLGGDPNDK